MCCRELPAGTTWPLQSGNPRHALAAPKFAVSAPKRTVTKPSPRAHSPAREGRAAPGVSFAATINVASSSIAVPRWRITVHGGRRQPVPILDHRREVERREQLAIAERPVLAAAQSRSGDSDDGTEDDEQVGEGRRGP